MQIAAQSCSFCGERIAFVHEARGCPSCQIVWHLDCHEGKDLCPNCTLNVTQVAQGEASIQAAKMTAAAARGRSIYWLALGGYLLPLAIYQVLTFRALGMGFGALYVTARITIYLVIWTYAYTGSSTARKVLGFLATLGLLFSPMAYMGSNLIFAATLLSLLFTLWACWFSPQVRIYESTRRR